MNQVEPGAIELSTESLSIQFDGEGALSVYERRSGKRLLRAKKPRYLRPVINGKPVRMRLASIEHDAGRVTLVYRGLGLSALSVTFVVATGCDAIDFSITWVSRQAVQLNRLEVFPKETEVPLIEAFNYRNRHHIASASPELPLGGKGCSTDTYSGDWQFAPHPTALLLKANEVLLFLGAMDLPSAFGLYFSAEDYRLNHWYLDYGSAPHGYPLKLGERFTSPVFRLFLRHHDRPEDMYLEFGRMLVQAGRIPDPGDKPRAAWWREPLYCTWVDQFLQVDARIPDSLPEQAAAESPAVAALDEQLVEEAVAVIERERLPFRTILLDDGWQTARGQWEPHPQRFPDMRRLVDRLHARGFKVVIWWNWAEIEAKAVVNPKHLADGGRLNRHGCRMRDYSHPATQEEYLRPLFETLFSEKRGCYDFDGVKTDFLADKVHPDFPVFDLRWRGEENYFMETTRLFYREMRRHKPDAVHIGAAGHYWLADLIDINRTYDVHNSNWREHEQRATMLAATAPGCPVAYDFHTFEENLEQWFMAACEQRAAVQVGNVLWKRRGLFSPVVRADAGYWTKLRQGLNQALLG